MTGIDPARRWRGRYDTQEGALGFVRAQRGLVRVFALAAADSGLQRARLALPGAVGVIRSTDPHVPVMGAVCIAPDFWSTVAPNGGLIAARTRAVIAWELPPQCRRPSLS